MGDRFGQWGNEGEGSVDCGFDGEGLNGLDLKGKKGF